MESTFWHDRFIDPFIGGLYVGQLGALRYILDKTGNKISKGYHYFWIDNGTLKGNLGGNTETVIFTRGKSDE